jgi:hypothetical protein
MELQNKQALMDGQKALNDMIQAVAQDVVRVLLHRSNHNFAC